MGNIGVDLDGYLYVWENLDDDAIGSSRLDQGHEADVAHARAVTLPSDFSLDLGEPTPSQVIASCPLYSAKSQR